MTRALASVVLAVALCWSAPVAQSTALFEFHSNPWLNLHHFIRAVARSDQTKASLSPEERTMWNAGVAFYKPYGQRDVTFDEGMARIAFSLHQADGNATLDGVAIDDGLRATLQRVMPIYRKYWWPEHDLTNREWINAVRPLVDQYGANLSRAIARAYNATWPSEPVPVDLTPVAGPVGAFTISQPAHVTISSQDPDLRGYASLEILFHESSHIWDSMLQNAIDESAKELGVTLPRQLWHLVLFYTAGELTRRALNDHGVGNYVPYAVSQNMYARCDGCAERIAAAWTPYLDGKRSMRDAVTLLVMSYK